MDQEQGGVISEVKVLNYCIESLLSKGVKRRVLLCENGGAEEVQESFTRCQSL